MALTLSKTGITDGQTIQVGHVTQSIDAFTKVTAYDISLSGSLTLTGSVQSFNGFTGSFTGSHFGTANLSGSFTGSFSGSHFGTANLSGSFTGSFTGSHFGTANLSGSFTGSYLGTANLTGSLTGSHFGTANLSGSFTGSFTGSYLGTANLTGSYSGSFTGTLAGTASGANFINNTPTPSYLPSASIGVNFLNGALGILAGSIKLGSGVSAEINPAALSGKKFQTQYWVTATKASGSTSPGNNALMVEETAPLSGVFLIKDIAASTNDDVNFIVVYVQ